MNKNTDPRARAAERALSTLAELRVLWTEYRAARRNVTVGTERARDEAVRRTLQLEREFEAKLWPHHPARDEFAADIPGRPGWAIEYEQEAGRAERPLLGDVGMAEAGGYRAALEAK